MNAEEAWLRVMVAVAFPAQRFAVRVAANDLAGNYHMHATWFLKCDVHNRGDGISKPSTGRDAM